jgi:hypothetical protein
LIRIASCQTNRLFILLERAEKEICFSMANGTFKIKMDIDRHGPRLMPNNCKNLNPSYFSLPSTLKSLQTVSSDWSASDWSASKDLKDAMHRASCPQLCTTRLRLSIATLRPVQLGCQLVLHCTLSRSCYCPQIRAQPASATATPDQ